MESEEFKVMREKALKQLFSGESLTGKDGVFGPLIKQFLETALSAEMSAHLSEAERSKGNKRNGKGQKTLKTLAGDISIDTPQDRLSTFTPSIVKKRETILAENLAPKIIGLYGLGMSFRDISEHIAEMYGVDVSHATLSEITERVIPQVQEWQCRPLEAVYPIVWLDAMHYKVREGGKTVSRAVYNVLAISAEGKKDLIGMYVSESEGARFWLQVLTDLKARGLQDILIACIDNLNGFAEAIQTMYPQVEIQSCIIHQIRNSLKYVASKDKKGFMQDLKTVYQAVSKHQAELNLNALEEKWGTRYALIIASWRKHWEKLTTYFAYDQAIRTLIYTTNTVEGFHRQVRKVTKTKGAFPNDMAILKLIYLATRNISKTWKKSLNNWAIMAQQLHIHFGDRMPLTL